MAKLNSDDSHDTAQCSPSTATKFVSHPRSATLRHLAGCLTFFITYVFLTVIFIEAEEREKLSFSTFTDFSRKSIGTNFHFGQELMSHCDMCCQLTPRIFKNRVTHWMSRSGTISNQDTMSGQGHLRPHVPQTPTKPWLLSICQTGQGSLLEQSCKTSIEVLSVDKKVRFILIEKRPKQKELTG